MRKWLKQLGLLTMMMVAMLTLGAQRAPAEELRGTWISYLDWERLPKEEQAFRREVDQMMDRCLEIGMNTVFVHAHSHSDSYYLKSSYFPTSSFIRELTASSPDFDPFQYMLDAAHARGLEFHAWFNPYRVTGYLVRWQDIPADSLIKQWWNAGDKQRNVLLHDGQYYLNPSSEEVLETIVAAIRELVENYDVDGVHFDDYFYPELDDSSVLRSFDRTDYEASGSTKTLTQWRRDNVSRLVYRVHQTIKGLRPNVSFGVSPQGYVTHLRSDSKLFVDIDEWMRSDAYVDYIMPQLYWGFEARTSDGKTAPYAFENNLKTWIDLKKQGPVKLYIGLALYKGGSAQKDGNAISEWLAHDDIIAREVETARASGQVSGFGFYSYQSFTTEQCAREVENLLKVLQ